MRRFLFAAIFTVIAAAFAVAQPQPASPAPVTAEDETPILIKHLPNWETVGKTAKYSVTLDDLKRNVANQPILDSVSFEGGTEAVAANYGQGQLVIVEFSTPHFSVENDQRIAAKIQELKSQAQPVPTAYRRVGNYSVFVFNGSDEASANQLIDQVRYEKVVQWLGEDPHLYEKLQRYFAETSAGVLIAVLKVQVCRCSRVWRLAAWSDFCCSVNAAPKPQRFYSDAGGSVRLNLDELTKTSDPSRLLDSPK